MRRFFPLGLCVVAAVVFAPTTLRGELIVNGDFEAGDTGFTSGYTSSVDLLPNDTYAVGANPATFNIFFNGLVDHTTGSGNMMLVNGSISADTIVWEQTVTVAASTTYAFSAWAATLSGSPPAQLRLTINGTQVGDPFAVTGIDWEQFATYWNSGGATSATLRLYDDELSYPGNDFALDDISFDTAVPEPSSFALVAGLVGGAWWRKRRAQRADIGVQTT